MKVDIKTPPRTFQVGIGDRITIEDCGTIALDPDQMVGFVTESGIEYGVVRKDFGFYATPSTNGRLKDQGFRTALIRNDANRFYVLLVERGRENLFSEYLGAERQELVCWLDDDESLARIVAVFVG